MTTVRSLLERRAAIAAEMRQINDAAGDGDLTAEQRSRFDELRTGLASLEDRLARQAALEDAERRMAGQPIGGTGDRDFDREMRSFSIVRAIAAQVPGLNVDAARERELSQEIARRAGRPFQGIAVPMTIFHEPVESRVLTTTTPAGGPGSNLIQTTVDGAQFIDRLRAALAVRRLGARILSGLQGNLDIPRLKASATTGWVAENTPLTPSDHQFDKVSLTPKHAGALTELSRNMLMQPSVDVENLVRADFAAILAETVDRAAVAGSGVGAEPRGILNTPGIGSVAMGANGAALTADAARDLVGRVDDANADGGAMAFLTNTKVKTAALKLKDAENRYFGLETVFPGAPAAFSNVVPGNLTKGTGTNLSALIYGNWSDLILGYWSELDILVNPFEATAYAKGNVQVRAMLTMDIAVRRPASFAAVLDIVA
jgi:HK97 family phage major capsid protein